MTALRYTIVSIVGALAVIGGAAIGWLTGDSMLRAYVWHALVRGG